MQIDFNLILQNKNIILRPIKDSDLENLHQLTADSNAWKFYTHDLSDFEEFKDWVKPALKKDRFQFVILLKENKEIVGSSAFGNFSVRDRRIEIGWTWFAKKHQGTGINGQVKQLMLEYAFEKLYIERVEFKTDVLNAQARTSLKNINAIEEGVLRSHTLMAKGRRRDTIYYSILKSEWHHIKRENEW